MTNEEESKQLCLIKVFGLWKNADNQIERENLGRLLSTHPSINSIERFILYKQPFDYEYGTTYRSLFQETKPTNFEQWLEDVHKRVSFQIVQLILQEVVGVTVTFSTIIHALKLKVSEMKLATLLKCLDLQSKYICAEYLSNVINNGYSFDMFCLMAQKLDEIGELTTISLALWAQIAEQNCLPLDVKRFRRNIELQPHGRTLDYLLSEQINNEEICTRFIKKFPGTVFSESHWGMAEKRNFSMEFMANLSLRCLRNRNYEMIFIGPNANIEEEVYLALAEKCITVVTWDIQRAIQLNYSVPTLKYMIRKAHFLLPNKEIRALVRQLQNKNYPQSLIDFLLS